MSWDEHLFGYFYKKFVRAKHDKRQSEALKLSSLQRRSEIFLSALCEAHIEIRESVSYGGFQGSILFLPENFSFLPNLEAQLQYLEWRLLAASMDWLHEPLDRSQAGLIKLMDHYPRLKHNYAILQTLIPADDYLCWLGNQPTRLPHSAESSEPLESFSRESLAKGTEITGKTKDQAKRVNAKEEKQPNPVTHAFEKVMTAEDYQGGDRAMDGSDEIIEHSEALQEISLSHVIRTNQTANSLIASNALFESTSPQSSWSADVERVYRYPEWSQRHKKYLPDWCTLYETAVSEGSSILAYDKKTANALKLRIESTFNAYQWVHRQKDGAEIDLKMVIDQIAQARAGGPLTDRLYSNKKRHHHDFAIQILVDTSLSSDSYAAGRRIIDTIQEALNIFSYAFQDIHDPISIAAFSSHTRNKVNFKVLKDFDHPWIKVPGKISELRPDGYTRIGPALRHAHYRLGRLRARRKIVLLLSDAKPTDYDHYEGSHGLCDIQRAVIEMHASSCTIKVITLADSAQPHHALLFGQQNSMILKDVKTLSSALFHFWFQALR